MNNNRKKYWKWVIAAFIAIFVLGAVASTGDNKDGTAVSQEESKTEQATSQKDEDNKALANHLKDEYGLSGGYISHGNDHWRIDSTSNPNANDTTKWAEDYWNVYGSDGMCLYVVNFANHTTTLIRNDASDGLLLCVEQKDGSDGAELTLNEGKVFSGIVLDSYYMYYNDEGNLIIDQTDEKE